MPTQLVVEFPSRLRATSPRVRRELALGAGTALALSALTVALGVVLTGLVVFTGSWPGFAPGTGGEATLATTASRGADAAPAPDAATRRAGDRRHPDLLPDLQPGGDGSARRAARARPPITAASTACADRRPRAGRRPRRPRPPPRPPPRRRPAAAPASAPSQSVIVTPAAPVQSQSVATPQGTASTTNADHPPDHDDLAVLLVDVDADVDVDHVHRHDRAPQPAAVAPRPARAAAPCSGRDARPHAGSAAARIAAAPPRPPRPVAAPRAACAHPAAAARPAGRTRPAGPRRACAERRPSRSRRPLARPAPLTQPSRAFTDGSTSVAMSSIERRASAGSTQSVPQYRIVPKSPTTSRSSSSPSTT